MSGVPGQFNHRDYTAGWICALPKTELVAAGAMLDEEHPVLPAADSNDTNAYILGRIGHHNVVIACLPAETKGKVSAATVAKDMLRSFPAVRFGLMVGMGGWVPYYGSQGNGMESDGLEEDSANESDDEQDIRLGDVVVSLHSKSTEAVVQYDFGKSVQGKEFIRIGGRLNKPYDATLRDKLVQKEKIKCFEMEAAGENLFNPFLEAFASDLFRVNGSPSLSHYPRYL